MAHAAIARGTACPPFVAAEACREHIGEHPCDRRRPISEQRRDFPGVDFSLVRVRTGALVVQERWWGESWLVEPGSECLMS